MNNREDTKVVLEALGYHVDAHYKLKIRDEKTPSASIAQNGRIKDFGSGWYGSCVDLLTEFHSYTTRQAFELVNDILGISTSHNTPRLSPVFATPETDRRTQDTSAMPDDTMKGYEYARRTYWQDFKKELAAALPSMQESTRLELARRFNIAYSSHEKRLVMPICNESGEIITLWKYSKHPKDWEFDGKKVAAPKVLFAKNRPRVPFNTGALAEYQKDPKSPIFLCEGEKDCLNALGNGLRAITLGSACAKANDEILKKLKGCNLVICYDYDQAGFEGAKMLKQRLGCVAAKCEIIDWQDLSARAGFVLKQGFDLTDYLQIAHERKNHQKSLEIN